jgi:hypothetical protein
MRPALLLALLFMGACSAPPAANTSLPPSLIPYATWTPEPAASGLEGLVTAEMPLASPTPFTYTVQSGDTMGGIALKFGVSLVDLEAANPGVLPNTMSIGVSAQITLAGAEGEVLVSQPALLPLNILPPDASLPLAAFFKPVIPADAQPRVQILTAVRLEPGDPRYLPASTRNVLVQVDWDGRRAVVSGSAALPGESKAAASVWIAATAYDSIGRVVGWRRWEGGPLQPGGSLLFTFTVSGLSGPIARVDLAIEARP